jgi:hypothetical protein
MRALMTVGRRSDAPESVDRRIALRLRRQNRLTEPNPLNLWAVIDESIVHRIVGGPSVMSEQLQRLLDVGARENVTIQILPFTAGEHVFLGGSAALLEFPARAHADVVYLEGLAGDYYEEQPQEVERYRVEFERLTDNALSADATAALIKRLRDDYSNS